MSMSDDGEDVLLTRLIRHISAIQVRNLTPFPARDAFTSALSHPNDTTPSSSFSADDISILTSRRHKRTLSNASVGQKSTVKWENTSAEKERHSPTRGTVRGRNLSGSKVSFTDYSDSAASTLRGGPHGRFTRPRTSSRASVSSIRTLGSGSFHLPGPSSFLPDNSQLGLEGVIDSRLLETCLVVTVTETPSQEAATPTLASLTPTTLSPQKGKAPSSPWSADPRPGHHKPTHAPHSPSLLNTSMKPPRGTTSQASSPGGRPISDKGPKPVRKETDPSSRSNFPPSISRARSKQVSLSIDPGQPPPEPVTTRYISPVHRPSTNPYFAIASTLISQFSELGRSNASSFRVSIWGKMVSRSQTEGMAENPPYPDQGNSRWKMLDEWSVDMSKLVPVPEDMVHHAEFPSNTLLFQLAPHGCLYRVPARVNSTPKPAPSSVDYSSDPETSVRPKSPLKAREAPIHIKSSARRRGPVVPTTEEAGLMKTASWPDIFQLASFQASIADNNASVDIMTRRSDLLVQADVVAPMKRDISERQDRIADIQVAQHKVLASCAQKRLELQKRRATVERRRELLLLAREMDREMEDSHGEQADICEAQRSKLATLQANLSSTRASLVSVLAEIFPIELYSPPDLLFTILDLPLPIPLSPNDPAPPLSLPDHPQVNEDTIAAALGFIAEVLQLLSAYLGTSLTYPVTCVGSRSLIRDGISSMVGPRTFPLYAKGVDTYRFEYGVFLLNKNIELLMAEKDLRALDVRHTLPNLKNLLLILSHDATGTSEFRKRKPPETPSSSILELDPASDLRSENVDTTSTVPVESQTPPRSGATTPTPVHTDTSRSKSRSFLGLAPFAGFLRGRYPSGQEASTDTAEDEDGDDEDKRTIHGVTRDENGLGTTERGPVHGADISLAESRASSGITVP